MTCRVEEPPRRMAVLQRGRPENVVNSKYSRDAVGVETPVRVQGRIIGYLTDNTFMKRVQGSKHMLRKPRGWCISKQAFIQEVMPYAEKILIEDIESGRAYECTTEVFAEHAFEIERGNFEPQLALSLRFWDRGGNGDHQLPLFGGQHA